MVAMFHFKHHNDMFLVVTTLIKSQRQWGNTCCINEDVILFLGLCINSEDNGQ